MVSRSALFVVLALSASCAQAATLEANPIRKIATLMQDMQKEIEAEGEKEKVLYDDFMCFCETGEADLAKTAEGAQAKIPQTSLGSFDRESLVAFLQQKTGEGAPGTDQILGIMKQMLEDMEKSSAEADADEAKAAAAFTDLSASKNKEVEVATAAIETKTVRSGELAVSTVQTQDALDDSEDELADAEKFLATVKVQCVE